LNGAVFGSGNSDRGEHGLVFFAIGQSSPNIARLATHHGIGELVFHLTHLYRVTPASTLSRPASFEVQTTLYQYRVLDYDLAEILVYDWAPYGPSPVRTPHLHVPAAGSIILAQRPDSPRAQTRTFLGSLHLPTGPIALEDIVELLIREFQVVPRRADWNDVLARNRAAETI
jgi:hypothetical protein